MINASQKLLFPVIVVALGFVTACGEKSGAAKAEHPEINLGAPEISWKAKNHEQRMGFMAAVVEPRMQKLFLANDKSYTDFGCETCHGEDMELEDYEMPGPLYSLPVEGTIESSKEYDAEVTDFMLNKVIPEFKQLLNQGEGPAEEVSCFSCHPTE